MKIRNNGLEFRSPIDGTKFFFTPEFVAQAQNIIGSDIAMQLDVCLGYPASESEAKKAMDVTLRWEKDSCLWSRYKVKNGLASFRGLQ